MAEKISTEITVTRRVRGGLHVYTCDELPGLFVASRSDKEAYNDLPLSIETLMKLDLGLDITVTHKIGYAQFVQHMRLSERAHREVAERTDDMVDENVGRLAFTVHQAGAAYAQ